ncbi:MAG: hypothetical protein ACYC5O_16970 [Anaerolineae bacterium]
MVDNATPDHELPNPELETLDIEEQRAVVEMTRFVQRATGSQAIMSPENISEAIELEGKRLEVERESVLNDRREIEAGVAAEGHDHVRSLVNSVLWTLIFFGGAGFSIWLVATLLPIRPDMITDLLKIGLGGVAGLSAGFAIGERKGRAKSR